MYAIRSYYGVFKRCFGIRKTVQHELSRAIGVMYIARSMVEIEKLSGLSHRTKQGIITVITSYSIHYTKLYENEKFAIAKDHLLPITLEEHGLDADKLKIEDEALKLIIDKYTREAGVRQLKKP